MKKKSLVGRVFGMLTVLSEDFTKSRIAYLCLCECGNSKPIMRQSLVSGGTKSCGCLKRKYILPHDYCQGTYKIWHSMIRRCYNKSTNGYDHYSKKGITVCNRWLGEYGFVNFDLDMGDRPSLEHTIDRIDNDGIYEPSNCRWATRDVQANNRSTNFPITIDGNTKNLSQWARIYGINVQTVCERKNRGWDSVRAITQPVRKLTK